MHSIGFALVFSLLSSAPKWIAGPFAWEEANAGKIFSRFVSGNEVSVEANL